MRWFAWNPAGLASQRSWKAVDAKAVDVVTFEFENVSAAGLVASYQYPGADWAARAMALRMRG